MQIIPVVEIESILYHHPAVRAVAIVGMPDPRVGERAVAYMVVKPDASIDLPQVTAFLAEKKIARSYFPERVEILPEMPMTATGKIQKFVLREWARKFASTAAFAVPSEPTMKSRGSRARLAREYRERRLMSRPPVADWTTDFDHLDPRWVENPFPIWDELRQKCPIAHTERFMGVYLPTRYEDVRAIAYDTEHFSSHRVVVREGMPPKGGAAPITTDPPKHAGAKALLLPAFTLDAIERYAAKTREICRELVENVAGKSACDAAVDYAQEIPVRLMAHMLGIPAQDGGRFRRWIHELLELGITDNDVSQRATDEMTEYFQAEAEKRRDAPGDDLISYLLKARINGNPLSHNHFFGTLRLLLVAGIDTTWSAIGASLWHLATHDDDRRRLVADPDLLSVAVEEFLRAYSPVTMAREIVKETCINGTTFKPGEMVLLSFPAANRDPAVFPDADRVVIDRAQNRHAAFGLGIHRCIGSNLARMEIRTALEQWLARIPEFRLDPDATVIWSEGTVRGPRRVPILLS